NKAVVAAGLALWGVALLWIATDDASTSYLIISGQMLLGGGGIGLITAPATEAIYGRRLHRQGRRRIRSQRRHPPLRHRTRRRRGRECRGVALPKPPRRGDSPTPPRASGQRRRRLGRRRARRGANAATCGPRCPGQSVE